MGKRELNIAAVFIGIALIAGIVALTIFHEGDNTATIAALVSATFGILSFLSSRENASKIAENTETTNKIQVAVNGNTKPEE